MRFIINNSSLDSLQSKEGKSQNHIHKLCEHSLTQFIQGITGWVHGGPTPGQAQLVQDSHVWLPSQTLQPGLSSARFPQEPDLMGTWSLDFALQPC